MPPTVFEGYGRRVGYQRTDWGALKELKRVILVESEGVSYRSKEGSVVFLKEISAGAESHHTRSYMSQNLLKCLTWSVKLDTNKPSGKRNKRAETHQVHNQKDTQAKKKKKKE